MPGKCVSVVRIAVVIATLLAAGGVRAHCDSLDGPVVRDAQTALERGDPAPVLKWVSKDHEGEIREAFRRTLAVREKSDDARQLADRYFFETLVRIHRAGEGEGFTGLKPAGSVDPGIGAADKALASGSGEALADHVSSAVRQGIMDRFERARTRGKQANASVEAGREYVAAYVDYVHFVEEASRLASKGAPRTHHADPRP